MAIIKHYLKKIEEIKPWGNAKSECYLHWFGLTDSYYWFLLGQIELLRYSDDFVKKHRMDITFPYVDYQYARIHDDFLTILDKALMPIPSNVFSYIDNMEKFDAFKSSLSLWINNVWNEEDEQYDEIYLPASNWIYGRRLDSGYLVGAPNIYFFVCNVSASHAFSSKLSKKCIYMVGFLFFIEKYNKIWKGVCYAKKMCAFGLMFNFMLNFTNWICQGIFT